MSNGLPVALISGMNRFGAKKLADKLAENDIKVIEVSDFNGGVVSAGERVDYVFDFDENNLAWKLAEEYGARLTIIGVNKSVEVKELMLGIKVNWRVLNFHGVYGRGMNDEGEETEEIEYLIQAIRAAVRNNNLVLPERGTKLRLLSDADLTEAVMRGSFLSGTEGEVFEIWGEEVTPEDVAKVLIEEAKMTRYKVVESGRVEEIPGDQIIEENWARLRWRPQTELGESMKEALQEAFSRADEEGRRKEKITNEVHKNIIQTDKGEVLPKPIKRFEVEIEKEQELDRRLEMVEGEREDEKENLEKIIEEEYEEVEEIEKPKIEIKPILVKNSNARQIQMSDARSTLKRTGQMSDIRPQKKVERKKINWVKWGWITLGSGWLTVVLMAVVWVVTNYGIYQNINGIKQLINNKKYAQATAILDKTLITVRQQETEVEKWGLNRLVWGRHYQDAMKAAEQGVIVGQKAVVISQRLEKVNDGIFKDKDIDWGTELPGLKNDLSDLTDGMGMLGVRLAGDWSWVPQRWRGKLTDFKKQLSDMGNVAEVGEKLVEVMPEMLGTDGKRREYLVLLQNESELRPNGGFIGSYAILSFEGGKLRNFEIKDIYEADGQLKGHVEPPEPIKNYLGEAQWYMRDANWQADFGASSRDIQWFLEKETGRKVDGVIGVDLAVAKGLLDVIGEVYVPDFKEKINSSNLYEQAEFYSETNSFAGSVQKASFLGGLGKQLFEEIKNVNGDNRLKLIQEIIDLAQRNELQIALNNKNAAGVMANLGWNGGLYDGKCGGSVNCFADYLYIVEANLGVNKANYFLYRNIDQVVEIGNQTVSRVLRITYENTAKSNSWPGGDYKNYMRVYIPASSNLAEVSITNSQKDGVKTIYSGDSLKITTVKGKKEIGFLVAVPFGTKRIVELRYVDQVNLLDKDRFSYLNYIQKQSGYGDTGMVSLISMPEGWQANQVEPTASLVNGKLLFNQKLDRDIRMGVEISK